MKINVLKVCADGEFEELLIEPSIVDVRRELGAVIDNIKLFTDVQSFICRLPYECRENLLMPGVYGDVIFTGGRGSYLAGLSPRQMSDLKKIFSGGNYGEARLQN